MTCFISWLPSNFSERRKNSRETCWFLKSRKCVACVKSESYLLWSIPNSHFANAPEGLALGEKTWRRQNLSLGSCLPPPPSLLLVGRLCIICPEVYVFLEGDGHRWRHFKIQRNRFLMIEPRHHAEGACDGNGLERRYFKGMGLPSFYSDHFGGGHLLMKLAKQSLTQKLLLFLLTS